MSDDDLSRLSALAESVHEELVRAGVPEAELVPRLLPFREKSLPNFPVVRSGQWARLSDDSLAAAVLSVLRDRKVAPFEGLRNAMVKGSYHYKLSSS